MKVRFAQIEDAKIISEINVETWHEAYRGIIHDDILRARKVDDKRINTWAEIIQAKGRITLVCENDGKILGYLSAGPARDEYGIQNEIYALYVAPIFQKKGVGLRLIEKYKKVIKNEHFYLYTLKQNKTAIDFYIKNGGAIYEKYARHITIAHQELEEVCFVFG